MAYTQCYVFIDDSNLWIESQKVFGKRLKDTDKDSRVRVDLGRFLNLVTKERDLVTPFLYGAVPPRNDTVWKAAREKNYVVQTFEKTNTGKEEKLHNAISTDITKFLYKLESKKNVVFIVVTGNCSLQPAIELTLDEGVHVELWSWEHAMAQEFRRLANTRDQFFTANHLDGFKDEFIYIANHFSHENKDLDPGHAIVYRDVPKGKTFLYALAGHLYQLMRLFYIGSEENNLIVVFPYSKAEVVFSKLRRLKGFEYEPCSFPEYMSSRKSQQVPNIKLTNRFESTVEIDESINADFILDSEDGTTSPTDITSDKENYDDWGTELRRKVGSLTKRKRRQETVCKWGAHCVRGNDCLLKHTEYEKKLFTRYPTVQFKYFKAKECNKKMAHATEELRQWCTFAHDKSDSWCLSCKMYGHLTNDCKVKK